MLKYENFIFLMAALIVVLFASAGNVQSQNNATMPLYQLHGSGTSNPAPLVWRVMDIMMARTKPKIAMSYRSIGSGAGGNEFMAGASAFGCGDVPISNFTKAVEQGNSMMHVPYLVGSVSIFHNIPGIGEGMFLPPCTLAKIFRRNITKWNDTEIVAANPRLPDLKTVEANINVVVRKSGSSSTYAVTHYFKRACYQEWTQFNYSSGTTIKEWPESSITNQWNIVLNSQAMVEKISSTPFSLGYVESGQGLMAGLQEVELENANRSRLASSDADIAPESFIRSQFPLDDLTTSNWTSVNPVYSNPSSPKQWPLTLGTYFYVRPNLTFLGEAGGLLKIFLTYMLSDDVAGLMPEYGFTPLPVQIRRNLTDLMIRTFTNIAPTGWAIENGTQEIVGQSDFIFSPLRDSYLVKTVASLSIDSKEAKSTLQLGDAYQVHGSGSFVSAMLLRHAMQILESRARVPVSMTYRAVGSVEAQLEFAAYAKMYSSYNHFKVGDMPLSSITYADLNSPTPLATIGAVLQLPFAISALGLYHTKSFGRPSLALNCALLARIYTGNITLWSSADLINFNSGTASLADQQSTKGLTVFAMNVPSGANFALTGYLAKSCGNDWRLTNGPAVSVAWPSAVTTAFGGVPIATPEQMLAALSGTPNAIGYLPSTLGASSGLAEVQLEVGPSKRITSREANLTLVVTQALTANSAVFSNPSADLDAVLQSSLYGLPNTWPMPMVQYLYMYRNLSGYGYSGPLLKAFVEFLLPREADDAAEAVKLVRSSGLTPLPLEVRALMHSALSAVTLRTLTVSWSSEAEGLEDADTGAALYTFSANRETYDAYALEEVRSALLSMQSQMAAVIPTVLRVACTEDAYGYIRLLRGDVQDMASSTIRILDEMGPAPLVVELLRSALVASTNASSTAAVAPTLLVVHPGPLPGYLWRNLSLIAPVVQIPANIRPVAVLYKGSQGLNLSLCTLARIVNGTITSWNDMQIQKDNPGLARLASNPIQLLIGGDDDGDTQAVLSYIRKGCQLANCPEFNNLSVVPASVGSRPANILAELLNSSRPTYSALALIAASNLVSNRVKGAGLSAVALPSTISGTFVTPVQTPRTLGNSSCASSSSGCGYEVGQAYTDAVEASLQSLKGIPPGVSGLEAAGDWSGFSLTPLVGVDVYPVIRFDYLVSPADVSKFGSDGAALLGLLSYAVNPTFMTRMQEGLAPYFAALGARGRRDVADLALKGLRATADSPAWGVDSTSISQSSGPSLTSIVLGRVPPVVDSALEGSLAATLAGSVQGNCGVTMEEVAVIAQRESQTNRDKLELSYRIAVAALVLGLVLSVVAVGLAMYTMTMLRESAASSSSGCLKPSSKYEQQLDVPISHMEMRPMP